MSTHGISGTRLTLSEYVSQASLAICTLVFRHRNQALAVMSTPGTEWEFQLDKKGAFVVEPLYWSRF